MAAGDEEALKGLGTLFQSEGDSILGCYRSRAHVIGPMYKRMTAKELIDLSAVPLDGMAEALRAGDLEKLEKLLRDRLEARRQRGASPEEIRNALEMFRACVLQVLVPRIEDGRASWDVVGALNSFVEFGMWALDPISTGADEESG